MPEWLSILAVVFGLFSTSCAVILGMRSIKNTNPTTLIKQNIKEINEKLDNDNRRIIRIENKFEDMNELDRLLLRSVKAVLTHLAEGNHTANMQKLVNNIDEYLIER